MRKANSIEALLSDAFQRSSRYLQNAQSRRVSPRLTDVERLVELGGALAEQPSDPQHVLALLDDIGSPATVIKASSRRQARGTSAS